VIEVCAVRAVPQGQAIAVYGPDIPLPDLRIEIAKCERQGKMHDACGVHKAVAQIIAPGVKYAVPALLPSRRGASIGPGTVLNSIHHARTHLQAVQDRHAVGLCQYKVLGARF
jgi:hypothetical protein